MKKRIIAMVLSVAMMLTMFPTGVLADDFVNEENAAGITENVEGQGNENQGEGSDTAQVNVAEGEETQPETVQPENEKTEPEQNETDQAKPDQTETDQTKQPEPGSTVPDQAGTQPDDKQPEPEQPATDPAENGVSDGAESTEGEQAESKTEFTVTWESEGETILTKTFAEGTSKDEVENAQPAEDPVKEADGDVAYEFAGWTPDYADVTADQTYTATFEEVEQDEMVNTASLVEPADIKDQSVSLAVNDTKKLTGSTSSQYNQKHEWKSDDESVVSFTAKNSNEATVQANKVSNEPVTITHTYEQWKSAGLFVGSWVSHTDTWKITVTAPVAATSVSIEGEDSVVVFRDLQLTAKVEPTNAAGPYTWSSSNEEVLTVDESGKVTGKKPGTATVTLVVGSGETSKSTTKVITVTASTKSTDMAQVYNLLEPGKNVNSNDVSNWNGPLGTNAEVDVTGAYWTGGKNCFDNVANRVVKWPTGYEGGIVPRSDLQWNTIFEKYKERTLKELADAGITNYNIQESDVAYIKLVPEKISKDNSTNPDKHLDCSVVVQCKGIATAIFKLKDAGPNTSFDQVGDAPSYLVNGTHNVITSPETITGKAFPKEKTVDGVKYTFSGWYTNDRLEGDAVNFSNGYALPEGTTTFYAKYTAGYQVTYDLKGGNWGTSDPTQYTADEGSVQLVKAEPRKDGYTFTGWTVEGLGDTKTLESGKTFTMPGNEVKFTATWQANEVTVTITGHTATLPYNGTEQQVTGYDVKTSNPEYTANDFTFTGNDTAKGTNVGTYNMGLKAADFQNTNTNFAKVTFVVATDGQLEITPVTNEVTVTITGKTDTATYDGDEHTVNGYDVTISNELYKEADFTFSGTAEAKGTNAGTYQMGLSADQFTNTNTNFTNVKFEVEDGWLKIDATNAEVVVTITGNTKTVTYNGEEQSVEGYTATITKDPSKLYTLDNIQLTGTAKASRTDVGTTNMGLKAEQFKNTSKNFTNVTFVVAKDGWLKINPYMISIEPTETTFPYNGEEPKVKTDKIEIRNENDGKGLLLNHHVESIETEGSGVDAGTYEWFSGHNAKILDGNKDVTANYDIDYRAHTMTITPAPLKITTDSAEKTYDGSALTAGGKIEGVVERDKKDVKLNITGSQTNAGTSNNTYTIEWGTAKATNYKIDEDIGTLTINPREGVVVTITGNTDTVPYNGVEQSVEGYTVEFTKNPDNLYKVADFKLNGEAKAAGTDAGTYNMGFVATSFENTNPNFKNVVFNITDGWLKITPKEIVPGENNKDLTATAPEDVVYNGESQQQKPIVKDGDKVLEEGRDYTLTYSEDTTNAGTVTVTITGNGNYGSKFEVTYKITPASLKITTNSAEKTYDGSALTADGKIEGVVERDKNDVKLNITGSQTEVGESKNTYKIEWGTAKASNYEITEDIGTLKVNARSGGGSSSKPTPEEEPTPTPTPTPLPTLPTTPAPTTPTRRVTRSTATVTEPASRPTEQITENETPKAESEPEVIEDEETPLAPMAGGAWALVNLILMLLTVLASLLLLLGYLGKKKYAKEDEYGNALHDANGNEIIDYTRNKKGFWRVASLIPAIAAVIAFALTENMRLPMVMTDRWTLLMVIIAVVQLIVAVLCKKKKESEEDENQANA